VKSSKAVFKEKVAPKSPPTNVLKKVVSKNFDEKIPEKVPHTKSTLRGRGWRYIPLMSSLFLWGGQKGHSLMRAC
jgi:hypothetical protein